MHLLRLDEYVPQLLAQGYRTVKDVTQLPWEDMEDIGIVKLGHQKKLLLAIKRIKDILSGKWIAPRANSPDVSVTTISDQCKCVANILNLLTQEYIPGAALMMNWNQQRDTQQFYDQMSLMNAMPPHLSPLSNYSSEFYQQLNYQQTYQVPSHPNLIENENSDIVLIKVNATT